MEVKKNHKELQRNQNIQRLIKAKEGLKQESHQEESVQVRVGMSVGCVERGRGGTE
jgi:hypothetical protein